MCTIFTHLRLFSWYDVWNEQSNSSAKLACCDWPTLLAKVRSVLELNGFFTYITIYHNKCSRHQLQNCLSIVQLFGAEIRGYLEGFSGVLKIGDFIDFVMLFPNFFFPTYLVFAPHSHIGKWRPKYVFFFAISIHQYVR